MNSRASEQPNRAKIEARHYINELLGANQTLPSHGENRGKRSSRPTMKSGGTTSHWIAPNCVPSICRGIEPSWLAG